MKDSELIVNDDGSIYHLALRPEELADTIITVGDPDRVELVTRHFDTIEFTRKRREFVTQTGWIGKQRITCLSTGMGSGNVDIVLNELDALANIDFTTRQHRSEPRELTIVRVGTSGSIREDVAVDDILVSGVAIGLEGIMLWYEQRERTPTEEAWHQALEDVHLPLDPYVSESNGELMNRFSDLSVGVTLTTAGFYAPQSRSIRLRPMEDDFLNRLSNIEVSGQFITNIEMETAAIYGLSRALGHRALSINAILANRLSGAFSTSPLKTVTQAIEYTLDRLI